MEKYDFKEIESKWQKIWEERAKDWQAQDFSQKPKFYALFEFPYPSGEGLHVGHLRGQTAVDVVARKKRLEGYNVMMPIGWDAFGLPTENYAIKNKIQPKIATKDNIESFKKQETKMGYFLDWPREINTTDPKYYKWTQWLFLQFYKAGLAYKAEMPINWCPSCKIGLAKEEVISGECERCGTKTEKKNISQWMLKITAYAEKLLDGLKEVDFPKRVKTSQENWIGKSEGTKIKFRIQNSELKKDIEVFTSRADTLFGVTAIVLSPEHPLAMEIAGSDEKKSVEEYIKKARNKTDIERTTEEKDKTGLFIGAYAEHPLTGEKIPVWVADYVLADYGTGAVMMVPAHDERDFEFAKKFDLTIKWVIDGKNRKVDEAFIEYGTLINSGEFDELESEVAKKKITEKLKMEGKGDFAVNYKLRDWVFSRQHYWGEPIPIVYCEKCGEVPVPEDQLPVILPEVEHYEPTDTGESPLAKITDWVNTKCPKCDGKAKRETDTMPNWAGSSWYFLRYTDPNNENEFAVMDKMKYWMPVDFYEGGMEHTTLHLLYSRFWNEFLFDQKLVPQAEPYKKRISHGIVLAHDGRKMSKSFGNVVNPDEIIAEFGTDTVRTYIMFMGPFEQEITWDNKGLVGVLRFLNKVWDNMTKVGAKETDKVTETMLHNTIKSISEDIENYHFNTAVAKLMELNNHLGKLKNIPIGIKENFTLLLYPFAPHVAEEIWQRLGNKEIINSSAKWPKYDEGKTQSEKIVVPIQINGKVRGQIELSANSSEDESKISLDNQAVKKYIQDKKIKKYLYVSGKIISIVVE